VERRLVGAGPAAGPSTARALLVPVSGVGGAGWERAGCGGRLLGTLLGPEGSGRPPGGGGGLSFGDRACWFPVRGWWVWLCGAAWSVNRPSPVGGGWVGAGGGWWPFVA